MTSAASVSPPPATIAQGTIDGPTADRIVSLEARLMGGRVGVHLLPAGVRDAAARDAAAVLRRLEAWAGRLTRFDASSDLSRLNADPRERVPVRPTLAAALDWGREAEGLTDGFVDIAMLAERLAAEGTDAAGSPSARASRSSSGSRAWSFGRGPRWTTVRRPAHLRFDLDGIGKGWLADRAVSRLAHHRVAVVDADGDVALALAGGEDWVVGVEDPDRPGMDLAVIRVRGAAHEGAPIRFGIATSGTSVHRWTTGGAMRHHLIDPRTGEPALTDVVQATVIARSARAAEAFAKTAVILGTTAALIALDRPEVEGAIILSERGELLIPPKTLRFLA